MNYDRTVVRSRLYESYNNIQHSNGTCIIYAIEFSTTNPTYPSRTIVIRINTGTIVYVPVPVHTGTIRTHMCKVSLVRSYYNLLKNAILHCILQTIYKSLHAVSLLPH